MIRHPIAQRIEALLGPTIQAMGYTLWGCEYLSSGRSATLRVLLDGDRGVNLADCQQVANRIGGELDVADAIVGRYHLEVSSPGLDRPLWQPSHFETYIGEIVKVSLQTPLQGRQHWQGTLLVVNEEQIELAVQDEQVRFPWADMKQARLVPNWDRLMKGEAVA